MNLIPTQKLAIDLLAKSSLDLDFFSEKKFSLEKLNHFTQGLKQKGGFTTVDYRKIFDRHEFIFKNKEILRVEFVYYNHEKKTLKKRGLLLGVYIDSLDDIAANKVMAYFDRNEPKDLFDIYFLIHKAGFTPAKLLSLVRQKFGISFDEASFWSESFKSLPLLNQLEPLMKEKEKDKRQQTLKSIKDYFQTGSTLFLRENLE